jgi:hypothetical protein
MADVPDYVTYLVNHERQFGLILGVDVMGTGRELYATNLIQTTLLAWLIKVLIDQGTITEAQLDVAMQGILAGNWPAWLTNPTDNPAPPL